MKGDLLRLPVLHANETPVAMLAPGTGKTHRAYLWAYASAAFEDMRAVVHDFTESRYRQHPRTFLGHGTASAWKGSLVCDDYAGYEALLLDGSITEVGCMAHARCKFVELHLANNSTLAATAIEFIGQLYDIEREVNDLPSEDRLRERRASSAPVAQALHKWLLEFRPKVPDGSATGKAMDYSLNRWAALTRYLGDAALPIDNSFAERQSDPGPRGARNGSSLEH